MLLVVIALKIESHSAVFERQNCIAAGGRRFQMLKFRTRRDPE
jgi:lipopolysaccharide/colanic/teichoic acid biosynthesis glycosyltransferase